MNCPRPRVSRTGELECPACGLTWAVDDTAPECEMPALPVQSSREKRVRTRQRTVEVANRALDNIRSILRKGP